MKQILITGITFYQLILCPILKQIVGTNALCRQVPSCSAYAKKVVQNHGVIRGSFLATQRILHCQPFTTRESLAVDFANKR